jgi:hypothetical protein
MVDRPSSADFLPGRSGLKGRKIQLRIRLTNEAIKTLRSWLLSAPLSWFLPFGTSTTNMYYPGKMDGIPTQPSSSGEPSYGRFKYAPLSFLGEGTTWTYVAWVVLHIRAIPPFITPSLLHWLFSNISDLSPGSYRFLGFQALLQPMRHLDFIFPGGECII